MTFLDSNILLRFVIADDAQKAIRCERLLDNVESGKEQAWTHVLVIAEVVWVLTGTYRLSKERVADVLVELLAMDALRMDDKERALSALGLYRAKPIDFIDAYHAQFMKDKGLKRIYSYDTYFDTLQGIERLEP